MRASAKEGMIVVSIAFSIFSFIILGIVNNTCALSTEVGAGSKLTIWDETDSVSKYSEDLIIFYANYTNITSSESMNGTGIYCEIEFNYNGTWTPTINMTFNQTSMIYEYNRSFNYNGGHQFDVSCNNQSYANLETVDAFYINNTIPDINKPLPTSTCYEDTICTYDFSSRVTDPDTNDELIYEITEAGFTGLSMDNSTGIATVDCAYDNCTGYFNETVFTVRDDEDADASIKRYYVYAVNDAPEFSPVLSSPQSVYQNESFYVDADAVDEENNAPLFYNITYVNCTRPYTINTSCNILGINTTTGIINRSTNFTNDEVGTYYINFTVTDTGDYPNNDLQGFLANATGWQVIEFNILNTNDPPNITTNLSEQITYQNQSLYIEVNATDPEGDIANFSAVTLYRNLTVFTNPNLFEFNLTNHTMYNNTSVGIMNYTIISNFQVGNYTVRFTADDGNPEGQSSIDVNFSVYNINDAPTMDPIGNHVAVQDINFQLQVNATDIDDFASNIPYTDPLNGTLTYNQTFISGTPFFQINNTTGLINFTASITDVGNYTVNITVADGGNLTVYEVINISVEANNAPNITTAINSQTATQNQNFYLDFNGTDADDATQNITFYTQTYYRNMTLVPGSSLFPITSMINSSWPSQPVTGIMNYTPVSNSQVGNYTVRILLKDTLNVTDYVDVNFTIYNANDAPVMDSIADQNSTEDTEFYLQINVTDLDLETPEGDTLTYNITFLSGTQFFDINQNTGVINFTITNNSYEGNYAINVTVTDSGNLTDWNTFNLTHRAINDYPQYTNLNYTLSTRSGDNFLYQINATDEETNATYLRYNLTFLNGTQLFSINETTGLINFTSNNSHVGTYMLNLTVIDFGYNSSFQGFLTNKTNVTLINLTIEYANIAPQIVSWWTYPDHGIDIHMDENESVDFYFQIIDQNDDNVTCSFYLHDTLNGDESEIYERTCGTGNPGAWIVYTPSFQDSGNIEFNVSISDGNLTTDLIIPINVTNVNRPPELRYLVSDQKWPMNTENNNINLSYHFRDPDNENAVTNDDNNITYALNTTMPHITSVINQTTGIVTLSPASDWYGTEYADFTANDTEYAINSSNVTMNVTYLETETVTVTQTSSGGGSSTTTVTVTVTETEIASLTVVAEPMIEVKPFEEIDTPLKFINSGDVDLNDIDITVKEVSGSGEVTFQLKNRNIENLIVDEEFGTMLRIKTLNLTKEKYQVRVTGDVFDPDFEQSATIYLRAIPINQTTIKKQIRFVKDMFDENPPCMDLMELIISAEKELGQGNIIKAQNLTQLALDNCRDLIQFTSNMTYSRPAYIEANRVPGSIVIVAIVMAVAVIMIATVHYIKNEKTKKSAREEFIRRRKEEKKKRYR